jgi:hypothetical protein
MTHTEKKMFDNEYSYRPYPTDESLKIVRILESTGFHVDLIETEVHQPGKPGRSRRYRVELWRSDQ